MVSAEALAENITVKAESPAEKSPGHQESVYSPTAVVLNLAGTLESPGSSLKSWCLGPKLRDSRHWIFFFFFLSSLDDSNVQPRLRTAA